MSKAIKKILSQFDDHKVRYCSSKLFVGDYMNIDNPRLIIDRKQSLTELCGNVCQQHKRFIDELTRANDMGIKLIILCEHGGKIRTLDDVKEWKNPRQYKYEQEIRNLWGIPRNLDFDEEVQLLKNNGAKIKQPPTSGKVLHSILSTISEKYNVEFQFCDKIHTGKRIIEILGGE